MFQLIYNFVFLRIYINTVTYLMGLVASIIGVLIAGALSGGIIHLAGRKEDHASTLLVVYWLSQKNVFRIDWDMGHHAL